MNRRKIIYAAIVGMSSVLGYAVRIIASDSAALETLEQAAIHSAVERVRPSVVRLDLIGASQAEGNLETSGPTSGLIVSPEGHVLTSAFAFGTPPASILVTLDDGRQVPATIIATDHSRQLVLLKLESAADLQPAAPVPSDEIAVGQWAIAVGRALAADSPNVSVGIVSAVDRLHGRAVQTDASISPTNYGGPLIDISGQVIGILTPLAPDSSEGASGADWYDSGIGFAVPIANYDTSLKRLQSGEDLHRGLAGIAFTGGSAMESPAVIASVRTRGPAAEAGLQAGDRILAIEEVTTETQAALRSQLGRYYSNDSIVFTIEREKSKLNVALTLVRELEPFRHAALGIRLRSSNSNDIAGVEVAEVLPNGPASSARLDPGDIIERVDEQNIAAPSDLANSIQLRAPGETVQLSLLRAGESMAVTATLSERSAEVYPIQDAVPSGEQAATIAPGETRQFKLPGFATACPLYVPSDANGAGPLGLLVVLQAGGDASEPDVPRHWQQLAERHRLVLAMPRPQEPKGWSARDIDYVRQLMRVLMERHAVDDRRVALAGPDGPNPVTLSMWLANRELVRGVILGSPEIAPGLRLPENEPERPCLLLVSAPVGDRQAVRLVNKFSDLGFAAASSADASPEVIAAWVSSLDRL